MVELSASTGGAVEPPKETRDQLGSFLLGTYFAPTVVQELVKSLNRMGENSGFVLTWWLE
ncbi:hypothetical protein A3B45_02300 [Candidatus Daviesbacteria bacterium RIFCSPLOWO2_01_FULL_39_12]|uniref:Uncharacterized protein n=1 Tax=Candidatus Daviesbacteria bacterium RIFCSPLOWO2_01_FULL_39_12 TaxID=1797785 RepID=A0A1F5KSD5_9BACT|nr:MAG: hypothetical protein A3D79_00710 [Candidatus Daviesbacteria bacterium RIFCSPHIGHO2_02_FULL_39_8]OGE43838.1 MAG: hypothetical protein A3B45_02300 [Candidatus Daviesbacteria bacterium RIFCSPLOWO2_01_FULL_39_12]